MTADALFWVAFMDWHVRTDHPWDYALRIEAMGLSIAGVAEAIGEQLRPALERATAAINGFATAYASAFQR